MTVSELVGIGINGTLVLITGVYAFFYIQNIGGNRRVADEMQLQRRELLRPVVSVGPEFDEYLVASLVIKNSGQSPAKNVLLALDKDFYPFAEAAEANNLKTYSAFKEPITTLAAGSIIRFDLAQGFNLGKSKDEKQITPLQFKVTARYEYLDQTYTDEIHVDLRPYMHSTNKRSKLNDSLDKIRSALETIARK